MLKCWKYNKYTCNAWKEVKDTMRKYNSNYYVLDRALNEISDFKQTGAIQKYLNDINRLNVYAKMIGYYRINMILNSITAWLRKTMAHYEKLR